jgi:quercetin dioxygenase-like cupin family protein
MEIRRGGSQPSGKGSEAYFSGTVRIDTHPLGQTLIVTAGCGRVQREGGTIEEIRPGDVVWFAPGEKHWHGAAPTTAMSHIAVQEKLDGSPVNWMEKVSDAQYQAG